MLSLCSVLVIFFVWIESKNNPDASTALWLPTFYMLMIGSRPLGYWFTLNVEGASVEEGSPIDRWVLSLMIILSIYIISKKSFKVTPVLKNSLALISLLIFLGISILWSDHTYVSLKRWVRLLAVIPIGMVVLTEKNPFTAMESIFRRCAYILIPFSLILAKYFPAYGVAYSRWSGMLSWHGVTLTKNALAQICLIFLTFIIWSFIKNKNLGNSLPKNVIIADGIIFITSLYLLWGGPGGRSATSTATFVIVLIALLLMYKMKRVVHSLAICLVTITILMWPLTFFSSEIQSTVHQMVGRKTDSTFTGRTDVWLMELEVGSRNPLLGTGIGSFWGFDENEITKKYPGIGNSGHNGLIDAFIEVGLIGIILILVFLFSFYRKSIRMLNSDFDWGIFGICFLITLIITNFTESIFIKSSSFVWNSSIILILLFSQSSLQKINQIDIESVNENPC